MTVGGIVQVGQDRSMRTGHPSSHIQLAEQPLLAAGEPLMARAAFGLAQHCSALLKANRSAGLSGARAAILVGPGNNGADALYAAGHLAKYPLAITVYLVQPPHSRSGAQRAALSALARTAVRVVELGEDVSVPGAARDIVGADLVIDALLGLGSSGPVRGVMGALLRALNTDLADVPRSGHRPILIAADSPTGVDGTTGQISDPTACFYADHTVTFGGLKTGLLVGPGALAAGEVHLVDIGLTVSESPERILNLECQDLRERGFVAMPSSANHKFTAGVLGQVTGSADFPGAAVLTAGAALGSGVGMVRVLGRADLIQEVRYAHPEIVGHQGRVQAWTLGSGVAQNSEQEEQILEILGSAGADSEVVPQVIDAGAIEIAARHNVPLGAHHVLTPHAGELAQLLTQILGTKIPRSEVEADPLRFARLAQAKTGATVVLKGPVTIVVGQDKTFAQRDGTARMATAGSGDVLAGLMGSMLAQHFVRLKDSELIAAAAVKIHGLAGRIAAGEISNGRPTGASGPITASEIIKALPEVLKQRP